MKKSRIPKFDLFKTRRINAFGYRFFFGLKKMEYVDGVNSFLGEPDEEGLPLPDDKHILMWDFDDVDKETVIMTLTQVQLDHLLPNIHIFQTKEKSFHAYCFDRYPWAEAFEIVENTPNVDINYVKMSYFRGFFTLRFSPKDNREIINLKVLFSAMPETVNPIGMKNYVRYLTKAR